MVHAKTNMRSSINMCQSISESLVRLLLPLIYISLHLPPVAATVSIQPAKADMLPVWSCKGGVREHKSRVADHTAEVGGTPRQTKFNPVRLGGTSRFALQTSTIYSSQVFWSSYFKNVVPSKWDASMGRILMPHIKLFLRHSVCARRQFEKWK